MVHIGGSRLFWKAKRLSDVVLSVLLVPLLVLTAIALLCLNPFFNPGPLFFRQLRVGQHGGLFEIYKFRTMRQGSTSARFADTETHRITSLGRFMRRYRLDEVPQILNILKGEMSLIGPRPEQPEFVREYERTLPGYRLRHAVRPGLSGLSQVLQGYTNDTHGTERKLALDLRYIRQSGFRMEVYILWRTVITVATGYGAL